MPTRPGKRKAAVEEPGRARRRRGEVDSDSSALSSPPPPSLPGPISPPSPSLPEPTGPKDNHADDHADSQPALNAPNAKAPAIASGSANGTHGARVTGLDDYRLPFEEGDVLYIPDVRLSFSPCSQRNRRSRQFVSAQESARWYAALDALPTCASPFLPLTSRSLTPRSGSLALARSRTGHHPTLTVYGRPVTQSRATAVYSTTPSSMRYSGTEVVTHSPFPPLLEEIRRRVQDRLGVEFGTCMLNRYEDGGVYIGCVSTGFRLCLC